MPADAPTIVATSTGFARGGRTYFSFGPTLRFVLERAGVSGRRPRLCHVGTASGDDRWRNAQLSEAGEQAGVAVSHCNLFPMPPTADLEGYLLEHDAVWVGGGSVANLLALWRLHGLDEAMAVAWRAGVVLAGVSAGSICWHVGGTTDSFSPELTPVTNGLAFLPFANGVHYDSEARRRPLLQALVADGTLPEAYATDDGVGLVYVGTTLDEVISEVPGKAAYLVRREGDRAVEERLEPRLLSA